MVSALLENGVQHLESRDYESIDQVRDSMSLSHSAHPHAAERKNYLDILQLWKRAV
jgi:hypothetical protein